MNNYITKCRLSIFAKALIVCCTFIASAISVTAQITVSANKTALELATALTGTGVTVLSPTLICNGQANGIYTTGVTPPLGIPAGIVLSSGAVVDTMGNFGLAHPAGTFANGNFAGPGDADLSVLAGGATEDACVLEFDFKAAGDTVKFNYIFGSEEYPEFDCSTFNDVFGFLISGGAYGTPYNLARVPGTTIPVCINSVNCAAPAGALCTGLGPGSPFCMYYINNSTSTLLVYDGLTVMLTAIAAVSPCDTYHLKLGVADKGDDAYDSGVFIQGGSLTSSVPTAISGVGLSGLPYCVRGCAPGTFVFSTPVPQDTPVVIHYLITGSAVNGYDYATITTSVTIPALSTSTVLYINPLIVPPVGPKVVTLEILIQDPCHPDSFTVGATASLTILDSFSFNIVTPDTSICLGQFVHILATGDPIFDTMLHYTWTPPPTLSSTTTLITDATPVVTTTYTLTANTATALGCAAQSQTIKITIYNPSFDSVHPTNPTVCGYCNGSLTLYGLQTGFSDTVFYTYNGSPQPPAVYVVSPAHTITLSGLCAGTYSNIYVKVGVCPTVTKGPIVLTNPPPPVVYVDSPLVKTCVGVPVQLHVYATPVGPVYFYSWSPATDLSSASVWNPVVNPSAPGDVTYTVTVNPGTNPVCASTATITVHTLPNDFTLHNHDTAICTGEFVQVDITGSSEFAWHWAPPTGVSNVNIMEPVITPTVDGSYTVTASYAHCPDMVHHFSIEVDHPAPVLNFVDTICLGMTYGVDVTVPGSTGTGSGYFHYQWTPPGDFNNDTIPDPVITPATVGHHIYTVTVQPHAVSCAITDIVDLQVYPSSINLTNPDTTICRGASVQVLASGDPIFTYQWLPTAGIPNATVVSPLITPDTSAMYVVTASFHKCPDIHDTLRITVEPNPVVFIGGRRTVCQYDTIHLEAMVSPEWFTNYEYNWSPATNLDQNNVREVVFSGDTTMITLTVTTPGAHCKAVDSALIIRYPGDFFDSIGGRHSFCPHDTATLHTHGNGVAYDWTPGLYLSDSNAANPIITPITNQGYRVIATSIYGCRDTLFYNETVHPSAVFFLQDSAHIYPGETFQISPETNCSDFRWSPAGGLTSVYIVNPIASPEINTRYVVHAYTEYGCAITDTILIYVDDESVLAIPNAFAPGSGPNSEFKIIKRGIATLKYFRIFNRWGNLVFETTDIDKGWNGEYNGVPQPFGVFVYDIEAVTNTGKIFRKHGNTTLLR